MSLLLLLLQAWIVGIVIAAPVGPVGVLCIRRTLNNGWFAGFVAGSGAALADSFYGAVATFGIVLVSDFLIDQQFYLKIIGGAILFVIAIMMILDTAPAVADPDSIQQASELKNMTQDISAPDKQTGTARHRAGDFISTFFITLTNPGTILAFIAIFAGTGLTIYADKPFHASMIVGGVFLGSLSWWMGLSGLVSFFDRRIHKNIQHRINLISGLVILAFAILSWASIAFGKIM